MDDACRADLAALADQLHGYQVIIAEAITCWLATHTLLDEALERVSAGGHTDQG